MKPLFCTCLIMLFCVVYSLSLLSCGCGDDDDDDSSAAPDDDDDDDDSSDDTQPPEIQGTTQLADTLDEEGPYIVDTTVTDNVGVAGVILYYRAGAGTMEQITMELSTGTYQGQIPGQPDGTTVTYYIEATDEAGNSATDPSDAPTEVYSFEVIEKVDDSMQDDDGGAEVGWNIASGADGNMPAKIFTPVSYPSYLTEVSVMMEQSCNGIFEFEVQIYKDLTGGDPSDATLAWASGIQNEGMEENYTLEWFDYDVADTFEGNPLESGTWIVGVQNHSGQLYLGGDTNFPYPDTKCWVLHKDLDQWEPMGDYLSLSWEGTFVVRAQGFYLID